MGEAKRRGSFEQRKIGSIERHRIEISERRKREAECEARKTPTQRQREHRAMMVLAMFSELTAGIDYPFEYKNYSHI